MPRDAAAAPRRRAVVIGAGFGGLAAALRLRAQGCDVTLLERGPGPGGRGRDGSVGGARLDGGPTVLTAPSMLRELFALFGERLEDHLELLAPSPWWRFVFADGRTLEDGPGDTLAASAARLAPDDAAGLARFADHAADLCETGFDRLGAGPMHDARAALAQVPQAARLKAWRSMWGTVAAHVRDPRLRMALSAPTLFLGGDPFRASGLYALIHHLQRREGVWYPRGGMGAAAKALAALAERHGVRIRYDATVARVLVAQGRAEGVALQGGGAIPADLVVANVDPLRLYRDMLPAEPWGPAIRRRAGRLSMGVFVLHFAARRQWPDVAQHTILFDARFAAAMRAMRAGRIPAHPPIYLHRATATDATAAPPGRDAGYALIPVPNLQGRVDWARAAPALRRHLLRRLDETLLPGLPEALTHEAVRTPQDFETDFLSEAGAGFSMAPGLTQSGWFRWNNRGEGVRDLYVVGAGAHPGAGVPAVLRSAEIAAALALEGA